MKQPRRWIADEIERLDPERDYEAIWRLTSSYGLDDFALNLVYAHLFPHFYLPSHGARPLNYNHYKIPLMENLVKRAIRDAV